MAQFLDIENSYKKMSNPQLIQIAKSPEKLKLEIVPILQKELVRRNEVDIAMELSTYLLDKASNKNSIMTQQEIDQDVTERLEAGEPLVSIETDLKNQGYSAVDGIKKQLVQEEELSTVVEDYYLLLVKDHHAEDTIKELLHSKYNVDPNTIPQLRAKINRKAKRQLQLGYVFVAIALIFVIIAISMGGWVGIPVVIILIVGIVKLLQGYENRLK